MASRFLTELQRRVLVFDGAMGTSLHAVDLDLHRDYCGCENCVDILARTRPDVVQAALEEKGKTAAEVPIMLLVTIEATGTVLLGTEIAAAAAAGAEYPICSLGLNCATGPVEMAEHIQWLGKHWGAMGGGRRMGR